MLWNVCRRAVRALGARRAAGLAIVACVCSLVWSEGHVRAFQQAAQQEPPGPQAASPADLQKAIDKLGDLDYDTRTNAARTIRRTPAAPSMIDPLPWISTP